MQRIRVDRLVRARLIRGVIEALGFVAALSVLVPDTVAQVAPASPAPPRNAGAIVRTLPPRPGQPTTSGFTLMTPETTGIVFSNTIPNTRSITNQIYLNGSGVAAGDIDGDGRCDLFLAGLGGASRIYRNLGEWRFEDITRVSGWPTNVLDVTGAALVDLDGDRDLDLVINTIGQGTRLLFNEGRGRFSASGAMFNPGRGGMSLGVADLDGDGWLDLYVANYRVDTYRDQPNARFNFRRTPTGPVLIGVNGRPLTDPELTNRFEYTVEIGPDGRGKFGKDELGQPDLLLRGTGQGRFEPVAFTGGKFRDESNQPLPRDPFDWGLSVMMRDLNGDGAPDIYVCNDFASPDRIWINDGAGNFLALSTAAVQHTSYSSMGMDVADLNRDGRWDFLVVDMLSRDPQRRLTQLPNTRVPAFQQGLWAERPQYSHNTLFLGRDDGTFAEVASAYGLAATEWAWTPIFLDVDLDGYEDLLVSSGFERDNQNMDVLAMLDAERQPTTGNPTEQPERRLRFPRLTTGLLAFRNQAGQGFVESSKPWRFDTPGVIQGMCLADLDGDGDQDVIANASNGALVIQRNDATASRISVRLEGSPPNTHGIGAQISLRAPSLPEQSQEMVAGGRYLSCDEAQRTFAVGTNTGSMVLEVRWRNGQTTQVAGVLADHEYTVQESAAVPRPQPAPPRNEPWFEDRSADLKHRHRSGDSTAMARQPLLHYESSHLSPGLAWTDLNGDGWDDLLVASGVGAKVAALENDKSGRWRSSSGGADAALKAGQDPRAMLGIPLDEQRKATVLISHVEAPSLSQPGSGLRQALPDGSWTSLLFTNSESLGPIASGDIDGDGALDLVVGSRNLEGRYPSPGNAYFLRRSSLTWQPAQTLAAVGLVNGIVLSDLDGDGRLEVVLACEWGPIRVFRWHQAQLREITQELGLDKYPGWWTGVAAGDFDSDGRMDLAAGNWGRNGNLPGGGTAELQLTSGDFDNDGTIEWVTTTRDAVSQKLRPVHRMDQLAPTFPFLRERFTTHEEYASATLSELLGERLANTRRVEATWFQTTVFLNRGEVLQPLPLPVEAQLAPVYGITVADFDGDGWQDLFLAQNCLVVGQEFTRLDAGRGLILRGDGRGRFDPLSARASGIALTGEQRGSAVADYDRDGRLDLAVAEHGAATHLFRNRTGRPGLRVLLRGSRHNPAGIGARIRGLTPSGATATLEIHAGTGFLSQDSLVPVITSREPLRAVEVRWPGGRTLHYPIEAAVKAVELGLDGSVRPPP